MIHSKNNSEHYTWGDKCDSWILKDSQDLSVKQEIMPGGTSEKLHYHKTATQFFYILKGEAVLYVNEEKYIVRQGESISIGPGITHFISNETTEEIEFLVISSPSTHQDRFVIEK
ncbi:cupin [Chryseobacterium sp. P1-3]|uniref:Cupin n=1 Tax=Chryseobacterium gallinarum TaxID=1324352 RepID=A0A0G3LZX0_CHRGL|nr:MULTISPECIES: cupin domain-containing protein [Chryseobacterium]AKK72159.1 cupin [Chryseobacterium gallinarum]KFF75940.1 cupin [Chryseobacterium sp. P1-3]MCL8535725.1 cupin domain-containing protein [Chryseobacterium gallinarum]